MSEDLGVMVDWLTVELPDPVGVPVNSGEILRISRDGELEWFTPARLQVEGSWSSNMMFRARCAAAADLERHRASWELDPREAQSRLEISGNPAKFLRGHNLFGSADVHELLAEVITKAKSSIWPDLFDTPELELGSGEISRIDLTGTWEFERITDVMPFLRALEERVWCPYRGRGVMDAGGSTLYYGRTAKGKRAKDWALKLYWKGPEIAANPLPEPAYSVPGLVDTVNRWLRVELTLRTPELKRLGLRNVGDWTPAKCREVWESYVMKLGCGDAELIDQGVADLAALPDLKPRHVTAVAAWKAGNDMRSIYQKRTFYRIRKEVLDLTGIDISLPVPKSNVVPLRRVITASPALQPCWADHLSEALEVAA